MKSIMKTFLLLLLLPLEALAGPLEPSLRVMPLYMRLHMPLFQVVGSNPPGIAGGSSGGGGGGGFPDPGSNGILVRTAASVATPRSIAAGVGVLVTNGDGVSGNPTLDYDSAIIPNYSSGTASVPGTGAIGTFYFETDRPAVFTYPATDAEHWLLSIAAGTGAGSLFQTSATDTLAAITSTDDNTLVSNGSTWEKKALPSCTDTGGNHLNYDASTNTYSCGTSGSSAFDPSTTMEFYDDLTGGTNTSGAIGNQNGLFTALGTGTIGSNPATADTAQHPGLYQILAHATNDDSGGMITYTPSGSGGGLGGAFFPNVWSYDAIVETPASMTSRALYVGMFSSTGAPTWTSLIAIRFDTDRSDTTYGFVICDSSTTGCQSNGVDTNQDYVASTITPVAATWYRFRISQCLTCGPAGVKMISMRVNNETAKTFCSSGCDSTMGNLPGSAAALSFGVAAMTRAASTGAIYMAQPDYFHLTISGLSRY